MFPLASFSINTLLYLTIPSGPFTANSVNCHVSAYEELLVRIVVFRLLLPSALRFQHFLPEFFFASKLFV